MSALRPMRAMVLLAGAAVLAPVSVSAQDQGKSSAKTEATQIAPRSQPAATTNAPVNKVFIDNAVPPPRARASMMQADGDQIARPRGERSGEGMQQAQLSATGDNAQRLPQLSKAELDATLAQLTPAERSVLQKAIEGTDICDRPPAVAAIVALCKTRIETRSSEFTGRDEKQVSSEERLLRGGLEADGMPSVEAVIARLSQVNTAPSTDDFNNQAIASVALTPQSTGTDDNQPNLAPGTDAVINAIVQQLGGPAGGGGGGGRP
jgi:hypothetical protein